MHTHEHLLVRFVQFADTSSLQGMMGESYTSYCHNATVNHWLLHGYACCAGYLRLTTRKLVLRQIAHARGLMARAQEDPTYQLPAVWPTVRLCCF